MGDTSKIINPSSVGIIVENSQNSCMIISFVEVVVDVLLDFEGHQLERVFPLVS